MAASGVHQRAGETPSYNRLADWVTEREGFLMIDVTKEGQVAVSAEWIVGERDPAPAGFAGPMREAAFGADAEAAAAEVCKRLGLEDA